MLSFLLILYNFCANLSNDIYLPSLPTLANVFSVDTSTLQFTMTAWFAGVAMPQLFFGPLTDQYGRRPILLIGGICFILSTFACLSTNHFAVLILARFFQGVGVCSLNVTTYSILADLFDYKQRNQIMNKISMCGTLAPLVGPVLGGYLLIYLGWRSNFLVIFILGLISVVGLYYKLPESNLYLNPHALNFRNIYKNYYLLIKTPGFIRHLLPYCLLLGGLVAYLTAAPFLIISQLKVPPEKFGFTQIPVFSAFLLGAWYLSLAKEDDRIKKRLMLGIFLILIGSIGLLITSYLFGNNLNYFIGSMMCYAFGLSLCGPPLINEVMSSSIVSKGSASAFLGFGMAFSCTLSSLLLGLIYDGTEFSLSLLLFLYVFLAFSIYFSIYFLPWIIEALTKKRIVNTEL